MNRWKYKVFLWTVLMITVFLKAVEPASLTKTTSAKVNKSPSRITTTAVPSRLNSKSSLRNSSRPKNSKRTTTKSTSTTMTTITVSPKSTIEDSMKAIGSSSSNSKRKQVTRSTTTTTLSPMEIMNRIYQNHGMASHGQSSYYSHFHSHSSSASSSSTSKKKPQKDSSSSMDDIYRLHALAISQSSHNKNKGSSSSSSYSSSSNSKTPPKSSHSMENIYQQHSSMPSSMHHIMAQHAIQSHSSSSSSRPQKNKKQPQNEGSSSSPFTAFMQPLLKQLTPVGAGISVVLAPLLLFNGFLQFFTNMSRFLNNFAQTILPVRRPMGTAGQSQYFQTLGAAHLKRQPRDWLEQLQNMKEVHELTEFIVKALKESESKQ